MKNHKTRKKASPAKKNGLDKDLKKLMDLHHEIVKLEKLEAEIEEKKMKIHEIKKKIHGLFDKKNVGIAIVQDAVIKYANPYLTRLLGYTSEEFIGTPFVHYLHHEEISRVTRMYLDRLAGKDVPIIYTTRVYHKNGDVVRIELRASEIKYHGRPADFVFVKKIKKSKSP
ncbi:MAG: PAS domain S-box protein [Candidatus Aminicenantales bacterium]